MIYLHYSVDAIGNRSCPLDIMKDSIIFIISGTRTVRRQQSFRVQTLSLVVCYIALKNADNCCRRYDGNRNAAEQSKRLPLPTRARLTVADGSR